MQIKQSRINNPHNFLQSLPAGSRFYIVLTDIESHANKLQKIGFSADLRAGEKLLPKPFGSVSRFNAQGRDDKLTDLPKETCYRDGMVKDWHGRWHNVEIPYQRYQRIHVPGPSEELIIAIKDNKKVVISRELEYHSDQQKSVSEVKHVINLFLELFGECEIFSDALVQLHQFEIERRNWTVLPTGEYPWDRAKDVLSDVTKGLSESKRRLVDFRFEHITKFKPSKLIIGTAGFYGYVIFCFEDVNLYLLESRFTDNATYVFDDKWEALAKLTKSEIINGELAKDRVVHKSGWPMQISRLFPNRPDTSDSIQKAA
ncbi:hypothetical protein [Spirosoma aerophilum]